MVTFSEYFGLGKAQAELDFVDVDLDTDTELFVDPFALGQRPDNWSQACHNLVQGFFQDVVDAIRANDRSRAKHLLGHLSEPNETRLGFSERRPQGAGIGPIQAERILEALEASAAVKTGFISSLEESELMVEGISRDKISDLTTNVLRQRLATYTKRQCELHNVPSHDVPLPPHFDEDSRTWVSDYHALPIAKAKPVLLVPKVIVRYDPAYDVSKYYQHFVLSYLQAEHLRANTGLVQTLKNGRRIVTKKDLKSHYPLTKHFLFAFSREHPEVLRTYRASLERLEAQHEQATLTREEEVVVANMLAFALRKIAPGPEHAGDYHSLCIGIVEFLFFPSLIYPRREVEINEGRKRIDIVAENSAKAGILYRLHATRHYPCSHVAIECKNYTREVANPELDQLAGRFNPNAGGKVGFLFCRNFENRGLFIERCRDTFRAHQGLIVPFDDDAVLDLLGTIEARGRDDLDSALTSRVDEVWVS